MGSQFLTDVDIDGKLTVNGKDALTEADTQELLGAILETLLEIKTILREGLRPRSGRGLGDL